MRAILLTVVFTMVLGLSMTQAQYEENPHAVALKLLFVDYKYPSTQSNLDLSNATTGAELTYVRHLNEHFNFAVPFKLAKADIPTSEDRFLNDELYLGLDALVHFKYFEESKLIAPYILGGIGGVYNPEADFNAHLPLGAGINIRLGNHIYLNGQGEYRFGFDDLNDHANVSVGGFFVLGSITETISDRDGDGISDKDDACPDEAGLANLAGCPDRDNDGVADGDDACPDTPGMITKDGCPDTDGDGLVDAEDECPDVAGLADLNGCPDDDGDGIANKEDNCPEKAGLIRFNGCPDTDGDSIPDNEDDCPDVVGLAAFNGCPDTDGDGIRDQDDKCPTTAGPASNNGCPEIEEEDKETLDFAMRAVQFEFGSAKLREESKPVLNQIAELMSKYQDYKLKISGHTDNIGDEDTNHKLSEDRAHTCYEYLVNKGVNHDRITHTGYGESRPIATNETEAGRKKNRRVEFELYVE